MVLSETPSALPRRDFGNSQAGGRIYGVVPKIGVSDPYPGTAAPRPEGWTRGDATVPPPVLSARRFVGAPQYVGGQRAHYTPTGD